MMLRAVVVAAGVLAAGVASANVPSRLVNVQVKLTRTIAYYGANPIIVDAHGNLVKKPKTKPDELVGAAHSAASGDTSCIMTYNGLFDYANVGTLREHRDLYTQLQDAKDPRADNIDAQILQQTPMIPDGKKLCHGPTGRGDRNVAKPYDAFGPARLGDCFGQLRVKDY
jgi:hypothetical protein